MVPLLVRITWALVDEFLQVVGVVHLALAIDKASSRSIPMVPAV